MIPWRRTPAVLYLFHKMGDKGWVTLIVLPWHWANKKPKKYKRTEIGQNFKFTRTKSRVELAVLIDWASSVFRRLEGLAKLLLSFFPSLKVLFSCEVFHRMLHPFENKKMWHVVMQQGFVILREGADDAVKRIRRKDGYLSSTLISSD